VAYGPEVLGAIALACEADPSREACGLVVLRGGALEVLVVRNAADELHAIDPASFPRTSRDGYVLDARAQLRILRGLDATGGRVVAVWHSHVEAGAWFSEEDRAGAVIEGEPVLPGVEYLVFAVRGGRVADRRRYRRLGGAWVGSEAS
jgi:proteasome lid subunit RPN8/RPN11